MTFWMKTMVPLLLVGPASNVFPIATALWSIAYPAPILHVLSLPLNVLLLREMLLLTKRVEKAAVGYHHDMTWIKQ